MFHFNLFPVLFGGDDVSKRIKHAVSFQKPKKYHAVLCMLLSVALTACFSTSKKADGKELTPNTAAGKDTITATPAPEANTGNEEAPTPSGSPSSSAVSESYLLLDPAAADALKKPMINELRFKLELDSELVLHISSSSFYHTYTTTTPRYYQLSFADKGYQRSDITNYLVHELGAVCIQTTYYLTLSAEPERFARSPENNALLAYFSCQKNSRLFSFDAKWTCEYFENDGWKLLDFSATRVSPDGEVALEIPFVSYLMSETERCSYYTGYLDEAPSLSLRANFAPRDLDGDGGADRIYKNSGISYTLHFSSGETLDLNYGWIGNTYCECRTLDITGDGSPELVFCYNLSDNSDRYFRANIIACAIFTRKDNGTWEQLPDPFIPLDVTVSAISTTEHIGTVTLANKETRVFGPYYSDPSLYSNTATWSYVYAMEPTYISAFSDQRIPEKPNQTVIRITGDGWPATGDTEDAFQPLLWDIYYEDGEWKLLHVEAIATQTHYPIKQTPKE